MGEQKKPWEEDWTARDTDRSDVKTVWSGPRKVAYEVSNDDAYLIESAPELYRALESLLKSVDDNGHYFLSTEQRCWVSLLLAKARGE